MSEYGNSYGVDAPRFKLARRAKRVANVSSSDDDPPISNVQISKRKRWSEWRAARPLAHGITLFLVRLFHLRPSIRHPFAPDHPRAFGEALAPRLASRVVAVIDGALIREQLVMGSKRRAALLFQARWFELHRIFTRARNEGRDVAVRH
jgi:hypothetical protein